MKASGLRKVMEKVSMFFGLKLAFMVFGATEQLSVTLQGRNVNAQDAASAVLMAKRFLQRQRSESAFTVFYQNVLKEAKPLTKHPVLPRRKQPKSCAQEYVRQQYFEVLDVLIQEITRRFDQPALFCSTRWKIF